MLIRHMGPISRTWYKSDRSVLVFSQPLATLASQSATYCRLNLRFASVDYQLGSKDV